MARVANAADEEDLKNRIRALNSDDERVQAYIDFYKQNFVGLSGVEEELRQLGASVKRSFEILSTGFSDNVQELIKYANTCSGTFPRTKDKQTILAMCPVTGSVCANDESANYVFCCCSVNPMVEQIEANTEICSESKQLAEPAYREIVGELTDESGSRRMTQGVSKKDYFDKFQSGMIERYGENYDPPVSRLAFEQEAENVTEKAYTPTVPASAKRLRGCRSPFPLLLLLFSSWLVLWL